MIQLSILDCTLSLKTLFCNTNLVVTYVYMLFPVWHVHDVRVKTFCPSVFSGDHVSGDLLSSVVIELS